MVHSGYVYKLELDGTLGTLHGHCIALHFGTLIALHFGTLHVTHV